MSDKTCVQNINVTFLFRSLNLILAIQNKYFRELFRNDSTAPSVKLDFETDTLSACLEGMYTGTTPLIYDNVQDTVIAADYLGILGFGETGYRIYYYKHGRVQLFLRIDIWVPSRHRGDGLTGCCLRWQKVI